MRRVEFQNDRYYHIYNRDVDKREIFSDKWDYIRFIRSLREFNDIQNTGSIYLKDFVQRKTVYKGTEFPLENSVPKQTMVDIICYSLLPNHFHILLKQQFENGIARFLHKLDLGYTNYFNYKNKRSGSLFQGAYKSIEIKTDNYLNYLSCYINCNAEIHGIAKAENWSWSSFLDYAGERNGTLCDKNPVLSKFKDANDYNEYINIVIKESKTRKEKIKQCLLE